MPPRLRLNTSTTYASALDLPILPFLAPRVFAPWPQPCRRAYASAQGAQIAGSHVSAAVQDNASVETDWESGDHHKNAQPANTATTRRTINVVNDSSFRYGTPTPLRTQSTATRNLEGYNAHGNDTEGRSFFHTVSPARETRVHFQNDLDEGGTKGYKVRSQPNRRLHSSAPTPESVSTESTAWVPGDDSFRKAFDNIWASPPLSSDPEGNMKTPRTSSIRRGALSKSVLLTRVDYQAPKPASLRSNLICRPLRQRNGLPKHRAKVRTSGQAVRVRFINLERPCGHDFLHPDLFWAQKFAQIKLHKGKLRNIKGLEGGLATSHFVRRLSKLDAHTMRNIWLKSTQRFRIPWTHVMLKFLATYKSSALKFLVATHGDSSPPSFAVSYSLELIIDFHVRRQRDFSQDEMNILFDTLLDLLDRSCAHIELTQRTLFTLLLRLNGEQVEALYNMMVARDNLLHENTLLHFIDVLARDGRTEAAVKALQRLADGDTDFTSPKVESVCATVLAGKHRVRDSNWSDSDLFAKMLSFGLQPNITFYNILLQNAGDAGDSQTSWSIHDMMLENKIEPDALTYSILLHDAKLSMDRDSIDRIFNIVKARGIRNHHVATDLLHALFLMNEQDYQEQEKPPRSLPRSRSFRDLIGLYSEFFRMEPLRLISPEKVTEYTEFIATTDSPKLHPPTQTLVVMLTAILRESHNPGDVPRFYETFQRLLAEGHEWLIQVANSGYIHNAVILELGRRPLTLELCTSVIGDMLNARPPGELSEQWLQWWTFAQQQNRYERRRFEMESQREKLTDFEPDKNALKEDPQSSESKSGVGHASPIALKIPKPSVYTWSILLKAFMDHEQPHAAEKVLSMMISRGVEPNQVTWNSVLSGYTRMQDIPNAVSTVHRLEANGLTPNDITMRSLALITNKEALIRALDKKSRMDRIVERRKVMPERSRMPEDRIIENVAKVVELGKAQISITGSSQEQPSGWVKETIQRNRLIRQDLWVPESTPRAFVDNSGYRSRIGMPQ